MAADFERQSYWHQRFESETAFEWLVSSEHFMDIIHPYIDHLSTESRVLQLGAGTSDLQNHFRSQGLVDVINVDYEPLAADRGRDLERQAFGDVRMRYVVGDATQLPSRMDDRDSANRFDLVVDKSTCDAVACGGDEQLRRMARGIKRCLSDGGVWITLSFSADRFTIEDLPFHIETIARVPTPKLKDTDPDIYHWCYLLRPV